MRPPGEPQHNGSTGERPRVMTSPRPDGGTAARGHQRRRWQSDQWSPTASGAPCCRLVDAQNETSGAWLRTTSAASCFRWPHRTLSHGSPSGSTTPETLSQGTGDQCLCSGLVTSAAPERLVGGGRDACVLSGDMDVAQTPLQRRRGVERRAPRSEYAVSMALTQSAVP